ncbi:MAG TPA: SAM-dependent methyltransferase, partial [Candidatus Polarisedimenticolia bacterium]|nr:SAM-dependent methyltransferase [Candidatus Polarisedimenticolia bacterium]
VPGPSALAAAISICGFAASSFVFVGFLPSRRTARQRELEDLKKERRPMVFFEAPHRAREMAADLLAILGDRQVTLMREVTKMHEEVRRMTLSALAAHMRETPPRGEITLVVDGNPVAASRDETPPRPTDPRALKRRYEELIAAGADRREALKSVTRESGLARAVVYRAVRADETTPEE